MNFENLRTTAGVDVAGKRVLLRVDLNVPVKDGKVTDTTRLQRIAPCVLDLADRGARVIVISHYERPKERDPKYSLQPVAEKLAEVLGRPVRFAQDCIGPPAQEVVGALANGDIAVLENLRFHKGEEKNDTEFAKSLAALGDLFVGEAFSSSHRAHASTDAVTRFLPSYAGPLMREEITALKMALEQPQRPTVAVVGGAKVSTKLPILTNLTAKMDKIIIGGGMANTFLGAQGLPIGKSLAEPDLFGTAREIMDTAQAKGCEIVLPVDGVVAAEFKEGAPATGHAADATPADGMILDVGPRSLAHMIGVLRACRTVLWNGPLGAFEIAPFGNGTFALAREAAALTKAGKLVSVAGGGDTVAALNAAGVRGDFTYVSTAGGAFLEWLEGRELPGVAALLKAARA
jgi:phosphoglycerate kinase